MREGLSREYRPMNEAIRHTYVTVTKDVRIFDYQPGNATRYQVLFARNPDVRGDLLAFTVVVANFGWTMQVDGGWIHPSYVQGKMRGSQPGDAEALSLLIEYVTNNWDA